MKRLLATIFITSLLQVNLYATGDNLPKGARSAALAKSSATLCDSWAVFNNQACMSSLEKISLGVYFCNEFMVPELSTEAAAFNLPTRAGVFGLSFSNFGYQHFSETNFGLAYAQNLGKRFSFGLKLDYFILNQDYEYGSEGVAMAEMGIYTQLLDNLSFGAHVYNPTKAKISSYQDERLPTKYSVGLNWKFAEGGTLLAEVEKDIDFKSVVKTGIEYEVIKSLFLRAGFSSNPNLFHFGLGYRFSKISFDLAFSNHQVLGYSSHFSMSYDF